MNEKEKKIKYQAKLSGFDLECLRNVFTYFKLLSKVGWSTTKDVHSSFTLTLQVSEGLVEQIEHIRTLKFNKNTWSWGEKLTKID